MQLVRGDRGRAPGGSREHPALVARVIDARVWARDAADDHWVAVRDGLAVARASLWWRHTPSLPDQVVGLVGHYAAADAEAGAAVLRHACVELSAHGCTTAIGPIDGSTWHDYRLVVERGTRPPFFLEPDTPDDWPAHFHATGFDTFARYTSALVEAIPPPSPAMADRAARLDGLGYRVRPIDPGRAEAELDALYDVSIAAFVDNVLYTPIARHEFHAQYAAVLPHVDPRLVLLAEQDEVVVGYVFVMPDLLEVRRTGRATTAILKTLAVHPAHGGVGLGGLLVERGQRAAETAGLTQVIHALMLDTNLSQKISRHYGTTFRRYAVFARRLT